MLSVLFGFLGLRKRGLTLTLTIGCAVDEDSLFEGEVLVFVLMCAFIDEEAFLIFPDNFLKFSEEAVNACDISGRILPH